MRGTGFSARRSKQLMAAAHSFGKLAKLQPHKRVAHMKMAKLGMKLAVNAANRDAPEIDIGQINPSLTQDR